MRGRGSALLAVPVGLLLAACGEPPATVLSTPASTSPPTAADTPTASPSALYESPCVGAEFDPAPVLAERMSPIVEPGHIQPDFIRGSIDTLSGDPGETTVDVEGGTYHLRGVVFDEGDQGRIVDLLGQRDEQDPLVFHVARYEYVPYAVLTGRLWVEELCKMKCDDWLLFGVEQGGQSYTFGLAWKRSKYPELWQRTGRQVTLAGDLYAGRNWLGLYSFNVRYVCEN